MEIRLYRIIYDAIEDVQSALKGMLAPNTGTWTWAAPKCARCTRSAMWALWPAVMWWRENHPLRQHPGGSGRHHHRRLPLQPQTLQRDDAKEVAKAFECGMTLEKYSDIKEGDVFEAYIVEEYRD